MSTPLTVLISGGAGGLGKATATAFLASGANVAICDVHQGRIDATSEEWKTAGYDGKFLAINTNVTDPDLVQQFVDATVAKFGRLDVLVNNAGILDDFSGAAECTKEMWDRVIAVNLTAPYYLTKSAIQQFLKQTDGLSGGVIINICSISAKYGGTSGASYAASKHGLLGLSRNTAFTYKDRGIYSIAMIMGGMQTNVADGMRRGELDKEALARCRAAGGLPTQADTVPIENVAKFILFVSDRDTARNMNGGAIDFKNNAPAN